MLKLENSTSWTDQFNFGPTLFDDDFSNASLSNCTNATEYDENKLSKLNVTYAVLESLVAIFAVIGNALVITVFYRERRLRRRTNYYIISLALADFLVGLFGIPFAILVSLS